MRRLRWITTVALLAVILVACRAGAHRSKGASSANGTEQTPKTAARPSGCGVQQASGTRLESMQSGGIERTYRLHIPTGYEPTRPTPLVLNYHGFASNAWDQEAYTRMTGQADKSGFVTVAPDGSGDPRRWYIYGRLEASFVDDYAFTRELIDHLSAQLCIHPARVYATGMSNGGGRSSLPGCERNDRIAAIAPAAGSPYSMLACR